MSDRKSDLVLAALFAALEDAMPRGVTILRNDPLPNALPTAGIVILRDGDPGEPEITMSPLTYEYEHAAELEVIVTDKTSTKRDAKFSKLAKAISGAISADRTFGGLTLWAVPEAPEPADIPIASATPLKAAVIPIRLTYTTSDPLL